MVFDKNAKKVKGEIIFFQQILSGAYLMYCHHCPIRVGNFLCSC